MKKKIALLFIIVIVAFGILFTFYRSKTSKTPSFSGKEKVIFINSPTALHDAIVSLQQDSVITDISAFKWICKLKGIKTVKPGRYVIQKKESYNAIANKLNAGLQTPLNVKVDGVRDIYRLSGLLGKQLQADSIDFLEALLDKKKMESYGLKEEEVISLILPNTYEMYWTISPTAFVEKMESYYNAYWTNEKKQRAQSIGLTPAQVATLASIVKGETVNTSEAPKIAGLYLNRLRIGQPLEADPTVAFAKSLKGVPRLYFNDTKIESPYNTYRIKGLPPGPIFMTEPIYLDAVLEAEKHDYFFMCAQPGGTGFHDFSKNFQQHLQYAQRYRKWLNQSGIR